MPHAGYGIIALKDIGRDGWLAKLVRPINLFMDERGVYTHVPGVQASSMLNDYTESPEFPDFPVAYSLIGIAFAVVEGDGILVQAFA